MEAWEPNILNSLHMGAEALVAAQGKDGDWCYLMENHILEATNYIITTYHLGTPPSQEFQDKLKDYIKKQTLPSGGWGLTPGGKFNLSESVKAYLALKLMGEPPTSSLMVGAREAILSEGGAEGCNFLTKFYLCVTSILPWSAMPLLLVPEIAFLSSFTLYRVGQAARLAGFAGGIIRAKSLEKPREENHVIDELFHEKRNAGRPYPRTAKQNKFFHRVFILISSITLLLETYVIPRRVRNLAIRKCVDYIDSHTNNEEDFAFGLMGATMLFAMASKELGDLGRLNKFRRMMSNGERYNGEGNPVVVSFLGPTWDTAFALCALTQANHILGSDKHSSATVKGCDWLVSQQILNIYGDWARAFPTSSRVKPGGWCFQYRNPLNPDCDCTSMAILALKSCDKLKYKDSIQRGVDWLTAMQCSNGGWAAWDKYDPRFGFMRNLPIGECHHLLLDQPSVDVTARCVLALANIPGTEKAVKHGINFILREQRADGSWFGRWFTNFMHGTGFALAALSCVGYESSSAAKTGIQFLVTKQNEDGGWGECLSSYEDDVDKFVPAPSTLAQTTFALFGLLMAGYWDTDTVNKGIRYLVTKQKGDGSWDGDEYFGTHIPNVWYGTYPGFATWMSVWVLGMYSMKK